MAFLETLWGFWSTPESTSSETSGSHSSMGPSESRRGGSGGGSGRRHDGGDRSVEDLLRKDAIKIVRFTWGELMKRKVEVGKKVYREVLFKEVEMSRLFLGTKVDTQSNSFMVMLDRVVHYLEDPATMDQKLVELGRLHTSKYSVKKRHFKHFRQAFMKAIKQYIPWSERREAAWMWFWTRIIDRMSTESAIVPFAGGTSRQEYVKQVAIIHETFDQVMEDDPVAFGKKFYARLVSSNEAIGELFGDTNMKQQTAKFVSMVRHCINLLDDHRTFQYKLVELGKAHVLYKVNVTHLRPFGDSLIETLRDYYGDVWNDDCENSWGWFWEIVVTLLSQGIIEVEKEQQERSELQNERKQENASRATGNGKGGSSSSSSSSSSAAAASAKGGASGGRANDGGTGFKDAHSSGYGPRVNSMKKPTSD